MPLTPGMYCSIEIPSRIEENAIVIKRSALREGNMASEKKDKRLERFRVFVAVGDELAIRGIETSRLTKDSVVVNSGLKKGDLLITSDIPQAAPGMKIQAEIRKDDESKK